MNFFKPFTGKKSEKDVIQHKVPLVDNRVTLALHNVPPMLSPIPPDRPRSMILKNTGKKARTNFPNRVFYGQELLWVSRETDEAGEPLVTRVPREQTRIAHISLPFRIGNVHYPHIRYFLLCHQPDSDFFRDKYGRKIFHFSERFPCFDSYDYLYDHRCFHWFFLVDGDRLVRIYYADDSNILHITTDVRVIEEKCWKALCEAGFPEQ